MTLLEYYLLSTTISLTLWIVFVVLYRRFGLWSEMVSEEEEDYNTNLLVYFFLSFVPLLNNIIIVFCVLLLSISYIATFVRVVILGAGVLSMTEFESDIRFKFTEEAIDRMEKRRERKEKQRREKQREKQIIEMVKYK